MFAGSAAVIVLQTLNQTVGVLEVMFSRILLFYAFFFFFFLFD